MGTLSQYSVRLDGANEYISVGDVAALQFERTNPFSFSAWVLPVAGSTRAIVSKMGASPFTGYQMYVNGSGVIDVDLINNFGSLNYISVVTAQVAVPNGVWTHVVFTYDGSSTAAGCALYTMGVSRTLTVVRDTLSASILTTAAFNIGRRDDNQLYFNGYVDEVAAYNKQLSGAEVLTILGGGDPPNLTVTGPTANLVGYWKIGDGDTYPTATDSSASGNNGTYTNTESTDIENFSPGPSALSDTLLTSGTTGTVMEGNLRIATEPFPSALAATLYFKMRALVDPGPGYETWVVTGTPDFAGTSAGGPIQAGTAVVVATWEG